MKLNRLTKNLVLAGVLGGAGFALARVEMPLVDHANAAVEQPAAQPVVPVAPAAQQIATPQVALPNFTGLVQRYGPAVVNITVTQRATKASMNMLRRQQQQQQNGDDDGDDNDPFSQFFRGLPFGPNGPQAQIPRNGIIQRGLGSGFIVSGDGYIMTNAHVVDGATEVMVKLTDRREFRAKVIGSDKRSDIAVIKIDAKNLPVVSLGSAEKVSVGEWVVAIGSPFGFDNTVTAGIISAKARSLPNDSITPFLQTDVPVNPGNSGGPLFNLNGEVVGINSQIFSESGGFQGISFAIPIDIAINVKDQLVAHGKVTRARLGVTIQDVNQQLANSFKLPRPMGALVSDVESDGPAAKAGLKSGDVITKLDGREIDRSADLPSRVAALKPGANTRVEVWRAGKPQEIAVALGELKEANTIAKAETQDEGGRLGVAVRPLRPEEAKQLGSIANGAGLVVEQATGAAAEAGIQAGDVILSFNGQPVQSADQLKTLISKSGGNAALLVQRGRNRIFVPVELG
jgi:serine protease Do